MYIYSLKRSNPETGVVERPWRERDGSFVLGDPKFGKEKHKNKNAVRVDNYSEALELVEQGFSIRLNDGAKKGSLIAPSSLQIVQENFPDLDQLWVTGPIAKLTFSLDDVMSDLRRHILSQAADLNLIANAQAASAFIGFDFDAYEDAEDDETLAKIDLDRFNITRIATVAFRSAFRTMPGPSISEEDVDELEQIICASVTKFPRRHFSPLTNRKSPLYRTLHAAYYRWQISDGCFLEGEGPSSEVMTALECLTGMTEGAIRASLSKEKISIKDETDYPKLVEWLKQREGFPPLREDEHRESRLAWRISHDFDEPIGRALENIRSKTTNQSPALNDAEAALMARAKSQQRPTARELRAYAKAVGVSPDSFILAMENKKLISQ